METFLDRLKIEKEELEEKIDKLELFMDDEKFYHIANIQQSLLFIQLSAMKTYLNCLIEQIAFIN